MRWIVLTLLAALTLAAEPLTVAFAANLGYAAKDLVKAYEKAHPGKKVRVILGSSGKLTAQIRHGAPYRLFLSADMGYPRSLYDAGFAVEPPRVYARGVLALFSRTPRDLSEGLQVLTAPSIRRVAVANPVTAPYGRAGVEALRKAGLYERIRSKLIFAESVSQTTAYALTAADAGLVARSALYSGKMRRFEKGRNWVTVDPSLYTPIDQGVILLKKGANDPDARAFYRFVLSPEAKAIFERYGYELP